MSFSNNESRTILKEQAFGVNLTLKGKLVTPSITLNGQDLASILGGVGQSPLSISANCTGTNLTLSDKLSSARIVNSGSLSSGSITTPRILTSGSISNNGQLTTGSVASTSISNSGSLTTVSLSSASISNSGVLTTGSLTSISITNSGSLTTSGITNSSTLTQLGNIEFGPNGTPFTYIDFKTKNGNNSYDARITVNGGSPTKVGQGNLTINSGQCTINGSFAVEGDSIFYGSGLFTGKLGSSGFVNSGKFINSGSFSNTGVFSQSGDILLSSGDIKLVDLPFEPSISSTELSYLSGATSNIQNQISTIQSNIFANNTFGQSTYLSWRGKTFWNSAQSLISYSWTDYDGNSYTQNTLSPIYLYGYPANCNCVEITYSFFSDIINKQYQGVIKYYAMKWPDNNSGVVWKLNSSQVSGSSAFMPTINVLNVIDYLDNPAISFTPTNMEGQTNGFVQYTVAMLFY